MTILKLKLQLQVSLLD